MPTTEKNKYGREEDRIIIEELQKSPDNIRQALRESVVRLKNERGVEASVNQLSSRYYSYILPHYIEGEESIEDVFGSSKSSLDDRLRSEKLDLMIELTSDFSLREKKFMIRHLINRLDE